MNISFMKGRWWVCLALLSMSCGSFEAMAQKKAKKKKTEEEIPQHYVQSKQSSETDYLFLEGMRLFTLGDFANALKAFEVAAKIDSKQAGIWNQIAQCHARLNQLFKAEEAAKKAIELDDQNKYYYLLLAQIYEQKQDYAEGAKTLQLLVKKVPHTEAFHLELANLYLLQEKYDDALKSLEKAEKSLGLNEDVSQQKIAIYEKQGKLDLAISEWKKLQAAHPDEPRYVITLAELYLQINQVGNAQILIDDMLKKDPNNPFGHIAQADIYKHQGQKDKAKDHLRAAFANPELSIDAKVGILVSFLRQLPNEEVKAECLDLGGILVKTHPSEAKAYAMYGDILTISGKSKEALDQYLPALQLDPSHFKIWQQVVLLDAELNMTDSLLAHTDKALVRFPNQAVFWFYQGVAQQQKKNYDRAVVSFEEGKKLSTTDKAMVLQFNSFLGDAYHQLKKYDKSDEAFEAVLKQDADNVIVLNNYSYYLSLRKVKLSEAKSMSGKVIAKNPDNPTYIDTYAWILYELKEYDDAKKYFEKIIDKTQNGTIVEHYGDVLFKLGEKDKAVDQWKKAKSLGEVGEKIDLKIKDKKLYE